MGLHGVDVLLGQQFGCQPLTGDLHDFKGHAGLQPHLYQIGHNAVTGTDNL